MSNVHDSHLSPERLQAFLDGSVPSRELRRVEEHVAACARCAEELATWRLLFEDLDGLRVHVPRADFHSRVMSGVRVPVELPLAARIRAAFTPLRRTAHLGAGLLQDLADGVVGARQARRAHAHVRGCDVCTQELQGWTTVLARLSELDRFAPVDGFADGVMAGLALQPARAVRRQPAWQRALVGARRFLPRTRRAWAALSGVAVTPAVTFGLVFYAVFSHPTLTPQALASFTSWQLTEGLVTVWGVVLSGGLLLARVTGLDGLLGAMVAQPLVAAGGIAMYAVAFTVALRILYKNLLDSRSIRPRYASASAS